MNADLYTFGAMHSTILVFLSASLPLGFAAFGNYLVPPDQRSRHDLPEGQHDSFVLLHWRLIDGQFLRPGGAAQAVGPVSPWPR
jgi:hypothetical protein